MTADRAPEGLSEDEREALIAGVAEAIVDRAFSLGHPTENVARFHAESAVNFILADLAARLAEQGAVIARVEALARDCASLGYTDVAYDWYGVADLIRAALRPDPSAQGAEAEGVGT